MDEEHAHSHSEHDLPADIFECIRTRRSIRKYKDKQVPWDNVVQMLQAAKYAPCAGNIFNLKFVVVKDDAKRSAVAEACSQQYWMQDAPIHIIVISEPEKAERYYGTRGVRLYTVQACGAAIQNMLLVANSLGLGACWVGAFDEDALRGIINLSEHVDIQAVITVGYADETPVPPPKYRIEHFTYFERWAKRIEPPKTGIGMWSPYIQKGISETKKAIKKAGSKIGIKFKEKKQKYETKGQEEQG